MRHSSHTEQVPRQFPEHLPRLCNRHHRTVSSPCWSPWSPSTVGLSQFLCLENFYLKHLFNYTLITLQYCNVFLPYINRNRPRVYMCPFHPEPPFLEPASYCSAGGFKRSGGLSTRFLLPCGGSDFNPAGILITLGIYAAPVTGRGAAYRWTGGPGNPGARGGTEVARPGARPWPSEGCRAAGSSGSRQGWGQCARYHRRKQPDFIKMGLNVREKPR